MTKYFDVESTPERSQSGWGQWGSPLVHVLIYWCRTQRREMSSAGSAELPKDGRSASYAVHDAKRQDQEGALRCSFAVRGINFPCDVDGALTDSPCTLRGQDAHSLVQAHQNTHQGLDDLLASTHGRFALLRTILRDCRQQDYKLVSVTNAALQSCGSLFGPLGCGTEEPTDQSTSMLRLPPLALWWWPREQHPQSNTTHSSAWDREIRVAVGGQTRAVFWSFLEQCLQE